MVYELIRGELKKMSPLGGEHSILVARVTVSLHNHVDAHGLGPVFKATGEGKKKV
jgi:Uma2 family endonuclease